MREIDRQSTSQSVRQTNNQSETVSGADQASRCLTLVLLCRKRDDGVVDQRQLLVLPDQDAVHEGAVVAVVVHKHLAALLTWTQRTGLVREAPSRTNRTVSRR